MLIENKIGIDLILSLADSFWYIPLKKIDYKNLTDLLRSQKLSLIDKLNVITIVN